MYHVRMNKMIRFVVLSAFLGLWGCQSTELKQVSANAPERPINTPEQAEQLVKEHTK
jgi:hypothetical protein